MASNSNDPLANGARAGKDAGAPSWRSRGYLPHRDCSELAQALTFRLFDAVPQDVIVGWKAELAELGKKPRGVGDTFTRQDNNRLAIELHNRIARYEDAGHGACWLGMPAIAKLVQDAMLHFDAERYHLLAWCIMPNHVHALIEPYLGESWQRLCIAGNPIRPSALISVLDDRGRFGYGSTMTGLSATKVTMTTQLTTSSRIR